MNLPDTNIWFALSLNTHRFHNVAQAWLDAQPTSPNVYFCRATQLSLVRLLTTDAVMRSHDASALTNERAWEALQAFQSAPRVAWADEPSALVPHWKKFAVRRTPSPKLWMDAYLAAFAVTGQYRLITSDQAFKQFAGLDLQILHV